ncbi:hypothetical protein SAMN04488102_10692 [Alkalibacterium subtropicum]|uniref:Tfp pilus assembly protein PilO n=1 Tax=Alkalibacterium subtropicum TaxID=753702 RepID=A0A1I1J7X4_9LACT|nr:hypothetical protein [Alkalibacterium subtropicum]SFC41530.1 hypothetical protein SAMN04488102_10692 [Alkalibacterium subtropicum]
MTMKWTRETFLVTLTLITILFGFFYYGNLYFVEPVRQEAELRSQLVSDQQTVLAAYPPEEARLTEYEASYSETETYLPIGDSANEAMITLEQLALDEDVSLLTVSRLSDGEAVDGLPASFVKNVYQAEVSTDAPENFRQLFRQLTNEERVWNLTAFSYEKEGGNSYTGTFIFELFYYTESTE